MESKKQPRITENPVVVERYDEIKTLGKEIFAGEQISPQSISTGQVDLARRFLTEGAKKVNLEKESPRNSKQQAHKLIPMRLSFCCGFMT